MRQVSIPDELYEKIEKRLGEYGFKTVDEYVVFVLEEVLREEEPEPEKKLSKEEEELVKRRLRELGYLD